MQKFHVVLQARSPMRDSLLCSLMERIPAQDTVQNRSRRHWRAVLCRTYTSSSSLQAWPRAPQSTLLCLHLPESSELRVMKVSLALCCMSVAVCLQALHLLCMCCIVVKCCCVSGCYSPGAWHLFANCLPAAVSAVALHPGNRMPEYVSL